LSRIGASQVRQELGLKRAKLVLLAKEVGLSRGQNLDRFIQLRLSTDVEAQVLVVLVEVLDIQR
jgi:hypothetical protein